MTILRLVGAAIALFAALLGAADERKLVVSAVYVGPIEQKWNAVLRQALRAAEERGDIEVAFEESVVPRFYVRALRDHAARGVDLILAQAFGTTEETRRIADAHPNVAFLVGDNAAPHGDNLAVFDNYLHEPCYLMGILAGAMTKTNRIGMVGGQPFGEVNRMFNAFMAGARSVNQDAQFQVAYVGSWFDPPKAKALALAQVDSGADALFAERAGVVAAARERGVIAFGNVRDMNKQDDGAGVVVTSALWDMTAAVANAVREVRAGAFRAADYRAWSTLAKGGAKLAPYYEFEERIPSAAKAKVRSVQADILAGRFVVEVNDEQPSSTY